MNAVFLDIDGVLNSMPFQNRTGLDFDDDMVKRLADIVLQTDSVIILASTWNALRDCEDPACAKMYSHLEEKLAEHLLSIHDITEPKKVRPKAIHDYLKKHPEISNFVILDDDFGPENYDRYHLSEHLIQTAHFVRKEENGGLQDRHVANAIDKLTNHRAGA